MLNFAVVKLSLCVVLGIILGFYFRFPVEDLLVWGTTIFLLFIFTFFRSRKLLFPDPFFGIATFLIFIFLGIFTTSVNLPENQPKHYINIVDSSSEDLLTGKIVEKLKPTLFQDKFVIVANTWGSRNITGKILLNINTDVKNDKFKIGDIVAVPAKFSAVNSPLNPHQFDYAKYLENQRILRQINIQPGELKILEAESKGLLAFAGKIREKIILELKASELKKEELAIIQALLLGQRQDISKEVYEHYAAAGVIHILALSGLHVGIILLILSRILQPLEKIKNGKTFKVILILLLLWSYAVVAGLSPSIVRAVTMFSFLAVGMQINRRTNALNTLFMSLLVLLLINPHFLLHVGFQLSYAAVFAIILIQPHLYKLHEPNHKVTKYFWGIFTVTIAAQIGVLPLSLFYFHQFPGLFFLSNLLILPFLGIILGLGLLISFLAIADLLPGFLTEIYGWMISTLNNFVSWIASKEEFLFEDIYFSLLLCLSFYLLILSVISFIRVPRYKHFIPVLIAVIVVQAVFIFEEKRAHQNEAVIFHKSRNSIIGFKKGKNLQLFHDLDSLEALPTFLKNYKTESNIVSVEEANLQNVLHFEDNRILVIDSLGIYNLAKFNPEIVLLKNSPKINLERMISTLNPKIVIADGSNYPSYVERWKKTSEKRKLPFHATFEKGAFAIKPSDQDLNSSNN